MLFISWVFVAFLAITFTLYYLPPFARHQVSLLIVASLVFYAWHTPWLLSLLLLSIAVNVVVSRWIAFRQPGPTQAGVALGLVFNVGLLAAFKYGPLLGDLPGLSTTSAGHLLLTLPLPIGISFYTFESISLLIDTLRNRRSGVPPFIPARWPDHLRQTGLFVAFFPHLISGPILKADRFYPQIGPKRFRDIAWDEAFRRIVQGCFLKMVIADNLNEITGSLAFPQFTGFKAPTLAALLIGYSMEIFADFAGYSLIAIGLGLLFGYRLPENFNFPYVSRSIGEFWRRWHLSLSSWLREYLYFPLGGNRRGEVRTYLNLLLVMTVGGLWHGAAWSYAAWGLFHGLGLATERWVLDRNPRLLDRLPDTLRILGVFLFVTVGWLLFKLTDIQQVAHFFRCLAHNWGPGYQDNSRIIGLAGLFTLPVVIYHLASMREPAKNLIQRHEALVHGILLAAIVLAHGPSGTFIYFQF